MVVRKEKQYLVFDFEDGNTVKYDFATHTALGKKGKPVRDLKSQLSGYTIDEICECCEDKTYGEFLKFVKRQGTSFGNPISNIGTILYNVPRFARFEQYFSAGIENVERTVNCSFNEIPKGLVKICRSMGYTLSNRIIENYKSNPDAYTLLFNMDFTSLDDKDLYAILSQKTYVRYVSELSAIDVLISRHGYQAKALFQYIDDLKTYEAITNIATLLSELIDYARMMHEVSPKFDRYPRHFLTTHRIASRNYTRLKATFDAEQFKARVNKEMEATIGQYKFIYPDSPQDIKDEAVQQNNCVASYIQRVLDGECDIMFMRLKDLPEKSLVTLQVVDGKIVQAKCHFNYDITPGQEEAIKKWEKWYAGKQSNEILDLAV